MVILFSNRKNKTEKEIIEILTAYGADFISDKRIAATGGYFSMISVYKKIDIKIKKGIALIIDDTEKFKDQYLPPCITGICEDSNINALKIFEKNKIPVITFGLNQKNTLTISSYNQNNLVLTLQRNIRNIYGSKIYPADYKIKLNKSFSKEAILCAFAILLFNGKEAKEF